MFRSLASQSEPTPEPLTFAKECRKISNISNDKIDSSTASSFYESTLKQWIRSEAQEQYNYYEVTTKTLNKNGGVHHFISLLRKDGFKCKLN